GGIGRPALPERGGPATDLSCLGDGAVGGVALGDAVVGRLVVAGTAAETVSARPTGQAVVVTGGDECVVPGPAGEDVLAVATIEQVVAVVAVEHVVFTRPDEGVVPGP